jgi:hypothetical protein
MEQDLGMREGVCLLPERMTFFSPQSTLSSFLSRCGSHPQDMRVLIGPFPHCACCPAA